MQSARTFDLVVLAASAGGIDAVGRVLAALPADFPVPIAVVQHRRDGGVLPVILARHTRLAVKLAQDGEPIRPGTVYIAPSASHLTVAPDRRFALKDGTRIRHVLSSAIPLFSSAARALPGRVIAVILTGSGTDATDGVQAVKSSGGIVIAQDKATSQAFGMPGAAIATGCVDLVLPLEQIGPTLVQLVSGSQAPGGSGLMSRPTP
ncbi:MAG TPA: chemotaxis protein CheB [Gemmatimonadales bacterium]|nr:chemotaxis protein CheB [Gemmatimonadales bacterium]